MGPSLQGEISLVGVEFERVYLREARGYFPGFLTRIVERRRAPLFLLNKLGPSAITDIRGPAWLTLEGNARSLWEVVLEDPKPEEPTAARLRGQTIQFLSRDALNLRLAELQDLLLNKGIIRYWSLRPLRRTREVARLIIELAPYAVRVSVILH